MNETVAIEDPEYGFRYYRVDDQYLLEAEDGYRRVNESVVDLLWKLARGELTVEELRAQVEGGPAVLEASGTSASEVLSLVETYLGAGILRENEPVVEVTPPEDIALWHRASAFVLVLAAFGFVVAPVAANVSPAFLFRMSFGELGLVVVLTVAYVGVHEYGHYAVSARHFEPSVRLDLVNGVVPAVVTDTTGSWTLPRNRRIWINLAGPFLELVAAVPLVVVHYAFPGTLVVEALLLTVFGHVVFALNPLIHGDGFWIACDFFGVRDVRERGVDDLSEFRLSWSGAYVVLSYGFGALFALSMVVTLLAFAGVIDLSVPF